MIFSECNLSFPKQKPQCAIAFYSILFFYCLIHSCSGLAELHENACLCMIFEALPSQTPKLPAAANVICGIHLNLSRLPAWKTSRSQAAKDHFQTPKETRPNRDLIIRTRATAEYSWDSFDVTGDEFAVNSWTWRIADCVQSGDRRSASLDPRCYFVVFMFLSLFLFFLIGWWDFSMQTRRPILVHSQQKLLLLLLLLLALLLLFLL